MQTESFLNSHGVAFYQNSTEKLKDITPRISHRLKLLPAIEYEGVKLIFCMW